jgi:Ca2+-binding RTX toxin-like protein
MERQFPRIHTHLSLILFMVGSIILFGFLLSNDNSSVFAIPAPIATTGGHAQITSMPMTSMMANIKDGDSMRTNNVLEKVVSPSGGTVPTTSGNQFLNKGNTGMNTNNILNKDITPIGDTVPIYDASRNSSYISEMGNRSNNINTIQPLEEDISPSDGTMPSTSGTNTNQFSDKDQMMLQELKALIDGDRQCNSQFDNTIITWKNIVDRQKNIAENFGLADTSTITSTFNPNPLFFSGPIPLSLSSFMGGQSTRIDNHIELNSLDINKNTNIDKRDHTTITGTEKKDYIIGSPNDDLICSKGGNDVIFSDSGVDAIFTNGGQDTVQGGADNNQIFGGDEGDTLVGGVDDDLIVGRAGDDRLFGDQGNDVLEGDKGADYFDCGEGIDIVLDFEPQKGDIVADNCETT